MTKQAQQLEAIKLANETRKFEIELFWKRYNHIWVVNAANLAGYFLLQKNASNSEICFLIACFGIIISFCWILMCLGSKWWQESWEAKAEKHESIVEKGFFSSPIRPNSRLFGLRTTRFSVTGIAAGMAVSTLLLWFLLATRYLLKDLSVLQHCTLVVDVKYLIIWSSTLIFCALVYFLTKK